MGTSGTGERGNTGRSVLTPIDVDEHGRILDRHPPDARVPRASMTGNRHSQSQGLPAHAATGPYQVCPGMTPAQFDDLKLDIAERGVLTPIDVDGEGRILDGHHRIRACRELGITTYPLFVRTGLCDDIEKRTYARKVNTLRRQLTRAQLRDLIAGQLRDTPQWADARIARALGTTDKTVRATRRRLEATSEIPRLTTFEGTDGKTRPSTQPTRAIFVPDGNALAWQDVVHLAQQAAALPLAEQRAFWTAHDVVVFTSEAADPFEGCSASEVRLWQLFTLFLVRECGYSVDGASYHVLWIVARFPTVAEWLGAPGAPWRRQVGMRDVPASCIQRWETFAAARHHRSSDDLVSELRSLNPSLGGQAPEEAES